MQVDHLVPAIHPADFGGYGAPGGIAVVFTRFDDGLLSDDSLTDDFPLHTVSVKDTPMPRHQLDRMVCQIFNQNFIDVDVFLLQRIRMLFTEKCPYTYPYPISCRRLHPFSLC